MRLKFRWIVLAIGVMFATVLTVPILVARASPPHWYDWESILLLAIFPVIAVVIAVIVIARGQEVEG